MKRSLYIFKTHKSDELMYRRRYAEQFPYLILAKAAQEIFSRLDKAVFADPGFL